MQARQRKANPDFEFQTGKDRSRRALTSVQEEGRTGKLEIRKDESQKSKKEKNPSQRDAARPL